MKKRKILNKLKDYTYFLWLIFLILLTIFVTYFYDLNKKNQINYLNKSLSNIYLKNSIKKISSNLKPRYISLSYRVNEGDTYEKIINSIPHIIEESMGPFFGENTSTESAKLGDIPHLYSLIPLAQSVATPILDLKSSDGLVGAQYKQREDYETIINTIAENLYANLGGSA